MIGVAVQRYIHPMCYYFLTQVLEWRNVRQWVLLLLDRPTSQPSRLPIFDTDLAVNHICNGKLSGFRAAYTALRTMIMP